MSTRKPKPSLPYPTDVPEKRLQLITIGDKPRKTRVQARMWPAEEPAPRLEKSRLH
jgi:hypothetical protein